MKNECPKCNINLTWKLLGKSSMQPPIEIDGKKYDYSGMCPKCGEELYMNTHLAEKKFQLYLFPVFIWVVILNVLGVTVEVRQYTYFFIAILVLSVVAVLFVLYRYYKLRKAIPDNWPRYTYPNKSLKERDALKRAP